MEVGSFFLSFRNSSLHIVVISCETKRISSLNYLQLNEVKCNGRDDKRFLEFPSEMVECESVDIVNMCEACEL